MTLRDRLAAARWAPALALLAACSSRAPSEPVGDAPAADCAAPPDTPTNDALSPTRLLRRVTLTLTGLAPTDAQYQAMLAAKDDAAREAILDKVIDDALASKGFYEILRDFGHDWIAMPAIPAVADEPDYMASQANNITPCPAPDAAKWPSYQGKYAGAYAFSNGFDPHLAPCDGLESDGTPAEVRDVEPWWAPGTMVTVVGVAASQKTHVPLESDGSMYDCGARDAKHGLNDHPACGCGPNLIYCHDADSVGYANWLNYVITSPDAQRRQLWEEPARLLAHLAYYDRPLSDLIVGDYSVGTVNLQHAYVRAGRRTGAVALDADDSWWRPSKLKGPVDPEHDASDAKAWREFKVADRDPYLLADRNYTFDPRNEPRGSMKGVPAAGVLTMIGMLGAFPRERVRAARMLETFACEQFIPPPAGQTFNKYQHDPAVEGPCQVCHTRIDPAAIHFKRWTKHGSDIDLDEGYYALLGVGNWTYPDDWTKGQYPYSGDPFLHWIQWWRPGSKMTPIAQADADANPEARFLDYLPPDQALLGQTSDGTVGPLGFGKLVLASGAFDRCAVQKLHERFGGRAIDLASESGYLDALVKKFVDGGRKVRPFLKELTRGSAFRRGL